MSKKTTALSQWSKTEPQSTRERFEKWKEEEYSYWNDSASDLYSFWDFLEQEIANARQKALKEWEEMGEKIGIAKCINLIPEQKAIVPLWGDNKYYAWYNAGIRLTRDNFDKYFKSL